MILTKNDKQIITRYCLTWAAEFLLHRLEKNYKLHKDLNHAYFLIRRCFLENDYDALAEWINDWVGHCKYPPHEASAPFITPEEIDDEIDSLEPVDESDLILNYQLQQHFFMNFLQLSKIS